MQHDASVASDPDVNAFFMVGGLLALFAAVGLLSFEKRVVVAVADGYYTLAQRSPRWLLPKPWLPSPSERGLLRLVRVIAWAGRGGCALLSVGGVLMLLAGVDAFG